MARTTPAQKERRCQQIPFSEQQQMRGDDTSVVPELPDKCRRNERRYQQVKAEQGRALRPPPPNINHTVNGR